MSERLHSLLAEYRAALERDPHNPQLLAASGQVLEELDYRADAAQHYLAAALGYEQTGQLREAADCCARVLTTQPGNLDAVALLRRLGDGSSAAPPRPHRVSEGQVVLQGTPTASEYPADMSTDSLDRRELGGPSGAPQGEPIGQGGAGKRPRLRTRRPRRKVSPLDRTVVDSEPSELASPSMTNEPTAISPELQGATRGRIEGTLPPRRPRRTVSPHDRTEVEAGPEPTSREAAPQQAEADATSVERVDPREPVTPAGPPASRIAYALPEAVAQLARAVSYSRGEVIFREGDEGGDVLFIQAGQVQVSRRGPDGPQMIDTLEAGEFFGEMGMLGDGHRHATTRALRPTRVHVLTRAQARQLMKDERAANRALRRAYRDRLQELLVALSPLLRQLPPSLADRVLSVAKPIACPAGKVVIAAGRDAPGLFFVLLGSLEVLAPDGQPLGRLLGDGDCFGHRALLDGEPSDCAIRATRFAQLLRVAPVQLAQLTAEEASLARVLDQAAQSWAREFAPR